MSTLTIIWIALPFFLGFVIYLVPKLDRYLSLGVALVSAGYAAFLFAEKSPIELQLLNNFGVILIADQLSAFFILTNALVTAAVIFYCWNMGKKTFFYTQAIILHGSINAAFVCADFISLYVALEVLGIAAFLLIAYPRTDRSIWVGLRYLFVSNVALLFYLMGAILVYQAHHSFSFAGLRGAPPEALALIFLGLLTKGGIFVSGLWLPLTHSESETPVSALMSGVVVKAGVYPLVRCALMVEEVDPIVRVFGVGTALLGVFYAVFEKDTKRMLAFHTISQLGFILAAPVVGGFYALTHGLVKSTLFFIAGALPSRSFKELQHQPISTPLWIALVIASFSISGFPLLSGFGAKVLTTKNLLPWQAIVMNVAALGTAISFAKFIFLPRERTGNKTKELEETLANVKGKSLAQIPFSPPSPHPSSVGFWAAVILLIGGLVIANVVYYEAYTLENIIKPLLTIGIGWLAYLLIFKHLVVKLPRAIERFEHLIGVMTLILVFLFWKGFAWLGISI
ncbi:MAG: cation:proton antiporter [Phormidium sp.]